MDTRSRLGACVEWVLAAGCVVAVMFLLGYARSELRAVQPFPPVIAREAPPPGPVAVSSAIPPRAVAVPLLVLDTGTVIRLGEAEASVAERLAGVVEVVPEVVEGTPNGERQVRSYRQGRVGFRLVFEPSRPGAEPRLTGIYR